MSGIGFEMGLEVLFIGLKVSLELTSNATSEKMEVKTTS
jgi:hypothetical protein